MTTTRTSTPPSIIGPTAAVDRPSDAAEPSAPVIDVVVPVYNEERALPASLHTLHDHLARTMPFSWRITVADNGSTDRTLSLALDLSQALDRVRVVALTEKGRGRALKEAWSTSGAQVVCYTDVDLSTDLDALLPLVAPLVSGHSDVAIGSRLAPGASVARGPRREIISRIYNLILRVVFAARFSDAQCGFKAVRGDVAKVLLPVIEDNGWFFDTELLLLAEHNDLRIHEVAVDWVDDPDSRVNVVATAIDDLKGVARMAWLVLQGQAELPELEGTRRQPDDDMGRQLVTFALIGSFSTAISLAVFVALQPTVGPIAANVVALSSTALANLWANRRYTFGRHDHASRSSDYRRGIIVYVGGLALSTGALVVVTEAGGKLPAQVATLLGTWSATAVGRFAMLRQSERRRTERRRSQMLRPSVPKLEGRTVAS